MADKKFSELDVITSLLATDEILVGREGNFKRGAKNQLFGDLIDREASEFLQVSNNLSDLDNASTARTNLGVAIGSDVQAFSSVLQNTTASYTTAEETKLAGIETGAQVNTVDSVNSQTGAVVLDADDISDTVTTNKFTTQAEIDKLAGIEAGADVTDSTNVLSSLVGQSLVVADIDTGNGATEINTAASKGVTGSDANAVTGTAGTSGNLIEWNADGDAVDSGHSIDQSLNTTDTVTFAQTRAESFRSTSSGGGQLQSNNGTVCATFGGGGGNNFGFPNVDINGGSIDGTVIGANSPAAITGTTGTFSGAIEAGTTVTGRMMLTPANLTLIRISSGAVTLVDGISAFRVGNEGAAATDELDTINGGVGWDLVTFRTASSGEDVTFKHNTGNILCNGGEDITLTNTDEVVLAVYHHDAGEWLVSKIFGPNKQEVETTDDVEFAAITGTTGNFSDLDVNGNLDVTGGVLTVDTVNSINCTSGGDTSTFFDFDFSDISTANGVYRFGRNTNTSGVTECIWYAGDGSSNATAFMDMKTGDMTLDGDLSAAEGTFNTSVLVGTGAGTAFGEDNLIKPASSSAFLNIKGGSGRAKILLSNDSTELISGSSGNITFNTGATSSTDDGSEVARFTPNGLSFDGGTNTFSHYAEGTHVPVLVGSSTAGTNSYSTQTGRWTRVGRLVTYSFQLVLDGTSGALDSTGQLYITLPFTPANSGLYVPSLVGFAGLSMPSGSVLTGETRISTGLTLLHHSNTGVGSFTETDGTDSMSIRGTITYEV